MSDTLKASKILTAAGVKAEHAEAITEAVVGLVNTGAATKEDLSRMDSRQNTMDMKLNIVLGMLLLVIGKLFFK